MRRSWLIMALGLLLVLGATRLARADSAPHIPLVAPPDGGATPTSCPLTWQVVASPNAGASGDYLFGAAAAGSSDVWAVGYFYENSFNIQTRVEHWDGSAWTIVPSPNPGAGFSSLAGVAAVSGNDVWAVGNYMNSNGPQTLIEHWDGSAWSVIPSPNPGTVANRLRGVAALSSNDVWAVGSYSFDNTPLTLVEHWDGSAWSVVPSPNVGTDNNDFYAVTARSANDVWAVGDERPAGGTYSTLVEHWNGSTWSIVPSPNAGASSTHLSSVAAVSANDAWAVGNSGSFGANRTVIEHWDGNAWSIVASPNPTGNDSLTAVAAVNATDVWAVGRQGSVNQTLVERWDGSAWSVVPSPNIGTHDNTLNSVVPVSATDVWAVGYYYNASNTLYQTLAEHAGDSCPGTTPTTAPISTPAPPPSATQTPGPPTRTPTPTLTSPPANTPTPTPTGSPPPCAPAWTLVTSPSPGSHDNYLNGVAAISAGDVWAVGDYSVNGSQYFRTLIEHWDGATWSIVPSPNASTFDNLLNGVTAISTTDVWAAGYYMTGGIARTLVEHWDGSAWTVMPSPNMGNSTNILYGVAAVSSGDVWVVGAYGTPNIAHTLFEHWNGSAWSVVPSPIVGTGNNLLAALTTVSPTDVWAAGYYATSGPDQTLIEHWNGSTWTIVSSPNVGTGDNELNGLASVGANDVWVAGYYISSSNVAQTLLEHWDGSAWSVMPSPNVPTGTSVFNAIAALGANDIWAVGLNGNSGTHTLMAHWDGSVWTIVSSPDPSGGSPYQEAVAVVNASDVWTVGATLNNNLLYQTLVVHYRSVCSPATPTAAVPPSSTPTAPPSSTPTAPSVPSQTPIAPSVTPLPSNTPPASSATPTAPPTVTLAPRTATPAGPSATPAPSHTPVHSPTATATSCAVNFADVHTTDYFAVPVGYLACRGVISGYADGTFRPYNNTTRAQMVKIVVLGFGLATVTPPVPGAYTFADVPQSHPFYSVIETAIAHQVVSGYACGGPGEPCDEHYHAYFRPYANVTRGQLAKIVVNAADWAPANPAEQTFADVQPGSAFYGYVEAAVCRGIISGYACGGSGEPCGTPARPYFRQYNSAVRGQIAKIVYLGLTGPQTCSPAAGQP
jgi:hypothetical protein